MYNEIGFGLGKKAAAAAPVSTMECFGLAFTLLLIVMALVVSLFLVYNAKPYCKKCRKGVSPKTMDKDNAATHLCPDCGSSLKS